MRAVFVLVVLIQKSLSHTTYVETDIRIRLLDPRAELQLASLGLSVT